MMELYQFYEDVSESGQWGLSERANFYEDAPVMAAIARCTPVPDGACLPYEIIHPGIPRDISFGAFGTPIFSQRAADVVKAVAQDQVQAFPAVLISGDAGEGAGSDPRGGPRVALSLLRALDCLEITRSTVTGLRPDGFPHCVTNPVIRAAAVGQTHIFRLAVYLSLIIVTGTMKRAIEEAGLTGAWFKPVHVI